MALSDSSVIDRLTKLYKDTWSDMYQPLKKENTIAFSQVSGDIMDSIEELKLKERRTETRITNMSREIKLNLESLDKKIDDVSSMLPSVLSDVSVMLIEMEAKVDLKLEDVSCKMDILVEDASVKFDDVSVRMSQLSKDVSTKIQNVKDELVDEFGAELRSIRTSISEQGKEIDEVREDIPYWTDLADDPSVLTTNAGDRLMYNDGWYVLND